MAQSLFTTWAFFFFGFWPGGCIVRRISAKEKKVRGPRAHGREGGGKFEARGRTKKNVYIK